MKSGSFFKMVRSIFHVSVKRMCTHKEVSVGCIGIDLDNMHVSKNMFAISHFPGNTVGIDR